MCLIPNKTVLFSVNAFAPTKSPYRHYISFYIKYQGGVVNFLDWWRCGVCLTAIVTEGQPRATEGVHTAMPCCDFSKSQ